MTGYFYLLLFTAMTRVVWRILVGRSASLPSSPPTSSSSNRSRNHRGGGGEATSGGVCLRYVSTAPPTHTTINLRNQNCCNKTRPAHAHSATGYKAPDGGGQAPGGRGSRGLAWTWFGKQGGSSGPFWGQRC